MSKLKIYMCSGVGSARDDYAYWLDDTRTASNTRAVNTLLARINELCVELDYLELTAEERLARYNHIDLLIVALQAAKRYAGDDEQLRRAGYTIQHYINNGKFDFASTDDDERGAHLDSLCAAVLDSMHGVDSGESAGDFARFWLEVILPGNRYALSKDEQAKSKDFFESKGVGDSLEQFKKDYGDIGEYLYKSGDYFLYLYIPESKVNTLPYFLKKKIKKQRELYEYVLRVFSSIYGEESDLQRIIRTRIVAQFKDTPENVVKKLLSTRGIGVLGVDDIIAIISLVLSVVLPIILALIEYAKNVMVAKYAVPANIDDGCPAETDWRTSGDNSALLKLGAIGLLLYVLIK